MPTREYNFDGLIGPTHNYAGLSYGNVASAAHQHQPSQPRAAALQGLTKMKTLAELGIGQCVLPPPPRPHIKFLRELGFVGRKDTDIIESAYNTAPELVAACYSAASMWTANAATVSPSTDCHDGRLHLTPANLASTLHRSLEGPSTTRILRAIFCDESEFVVHDPLPCSAALTDEGAANHTRLCSSLDDQSLEIFVYGGDTLDHQFSRPQQFPARQTRLSSESISRRHGLDTNSVMFWQQNPAAIDAGVFHNDVISVGHQNVLLCHKMAYVDQPNRLEDLKNLFESKYDQPLHLIEFSEVDISLQDTVNSYLFNSQLVTRPDGKMTLVCPIECQESKFARRCTEKILNENNPIDEAKFLNLRQSMNNGGGPACLRLRVVLTESQQAKMHQGIVLTDALADRLERWINKHYRETLLPEDLRDPQLINEVRVAMEALESIIGLRLSDV